MNWGQFEDPVCNLYIGGCVVISRSITQEVAGPNNLLNVD